MLNAQQTVGSIALCAPTSATNKYLLTLLKLCAKCVEQDLLLGKEKSQTKMLQDEQLNIFNSHAHANIVVTGKGVIDLISDKACELLGLKRKDILHQNITTIIPDWKKILLSNSRQMELNNIEVEITNVTNAGAYLLNGRVLRVSSGLVDEMIFNLRSMKQVLSESNKYNGNIATFTFDDINCVSVPMKRIIKDAKSIAHLDSHVILIGEKYTGKRIIAEAIHNQSKRMEFGFVRVNLSNATEDEMEEILWGYTEKHKPYKKWVPKPGAFEFANGGSLYINEIGMLPLRLQDKLLETITTKKTSRLGCKSLTMVDVRIFATNSYDLSAQIDRGDFRIELFYALSGSSLRVPALRERKQDVPALLKETIEIKSLEMGKKAPVIPKKNLLILKRYEWPNNFKEMKEFAELLINDQGKMFKNFKNERDFKRKHLYLDYQKEVESIVPLDEVEMHHIIKAYKALGGSISKTSRKLGVSRNTLYLKLKKYGFDEEMES
ncbi:MAG: hypothetical protein CVT98_01385 [Bacteroidetes bacterium HGW-Bacteroidetes-15]|nr:MAG: hypothetical protein CVT98_01385 [Bacteroidetes bacterium HGW-Bacteroidetes-15]